MTDVLVHIGRKYHSAIQLILKQFIKNLCNILVFRTKNTQKWRAFALHVEQKTLSVSTKMNSVAA
jgi:hypothetical protein